MTQKYYSNQFELFICSANHIRILKAQNVHSYCNTHFFLFYGNLVFDKAEKRVTKNLFYDKCLTIELG